MAETSNKKKIPANIEQFQWNCSFNNLENREILEKELPDIYSYKIDRFKLVEKREEPHESKFEAEFLVDICNEQERNEFISHFEKKTGTNFNKAWTDRVGKSGVKQRTLKCSRNVYVITKAQVGGDLEVDVSKVLKNNQGKIRIAKPRSAQS